MFVYVFYIDWNEGSNLSCDLLVSYHRLVLLTLWLSPAMEAFWLLASDKNID